MAENSRQIYSSTSIVRCNDALKDRSISFDSGRLFCFFLLSLIKRNKCERFIFGKRGPKLLTILIFLWDHKPFFDKSVEFLLAEAACVQKRFFYLCCCQVLSNHVLLSFGNICLLIDVEDVRLMQQLDHFLLIVIIPPIS